MPNPIEFLCDLVALPSVNPMGRAVSGPQYFEYRVTDYLESYFKQLQLPYVRQHVADKRENIVAWLPGDDAKSPVSGNDGSPPVLMFDVHQDTVPVDGMVVPPFVPEQRNGRIYGRGSCDVKGGMAAMLAALTRLATERPAGLPTVMLVCSVNEEFGFGGAREVPKLWNSETSPAQVPRPTCCIVAEPTELSVVTAHKGVVRWRCHALGRASHSSQPELGDNAAFRMARVLEALEIYQHDIVTNLGRHALCGPPTISIGTIQGGLSVNTVPDRVTIEIDRRCIPGESPREAYRHAVRYLADALADDAHIVNDPPFSESLGLADNANGPFAHRLLAVASQHWPTSGIVGVPYGTNASIYAHEGVPTIVFGPGSIAQAHTVDEWIDVEQLQLASEIYYKFALSLAK
jgi:acetylornithine deacetylase